MTGKWAGSNRWSRMPPDWLLRRREVLARDGGTCQLRYDNCTVTATQVDHITAGDDHSLVNLQAVCEPCHKIKSSREGSAALPRTRRPPEQHPSL